MLVHFLLWQAAKPSGDKCTPYFLLFYSFTFLLFYAVCWRVPIRASTTFTT